MIARAGSGWQTVLADLSLILFMVTAAAVAEAGPDGGTAGVAPELGEPVAVWRPGGPTLKQWLAAQPEDPRLRLTLVLHAEAPGRSTALKRAETAQQGLEPARIVIEPGAGVPLEALLIYDRQAGPARGLQSDVKSSPQEPSR